MKRAARGITLVEVLVVVAIVGVMTGLGLNALNEMKKHGEVSGEARKLLVMLRNARTLSIITGVRHGVYYGGPSDVQNSGTGGTTNLRNRMVVFRKPAVGSTSTDYEAADLVQEERLLPFGKQGAEDAQLELNLLAANPGGSVRVVFNELGQPTLRVASGATAPELPFPGGTNPLVLTLRKRPQPSEDTANTRRCVSLDVTGDARILSVCP